MSKGVIDPGAIVGQVDAKRKVGYWSPLRKAIQERGLPFVDGVA